MVASEAAERFSCVEISLRNLPPEWLILWLAHVSDMSAFEITQIQIQNNSTLFQLLEFSTYMPHGTRFPADCAITDVMFGVLCQLHEQCGCRLAQWKTNGGILADGQINWRFGVFAPNWSAAEVLQTITYMSPREIVILEVDDVSKQRSDQSWHIINKWSASSASWQQGNRQAIP